VRACYCLERSANGVINDMRKNTSLSVGFILVPEFTLIAFSGFLAVLRQAADERDKSRQVNCNWTIMGKDLNPITSSAGVAVVPWETFQDPCSFDL